VKTQAKAAGATGWLTKPFDPETLIKIVRKVIGR
jgi:two-component system chemotaxis response regulator CheY